MKKIRNIFSILAMMWFVIACTGSDGGSSGGGSSSSSKGALIVVLQPVNNFEPEGGFRVSLLQGAKEIDCKTGEKDKVDYSFSSIAFGDYTVLVKALDANNKALSEAEVDFSMKKEYQTISVPIQLDIPTVTIAVDQVLPAEITKVKVTSSVDENEKSFSYKKGESFTLDVADAGEYTFTFSFMGSDNVEYFTSSETISVKDGSNQVTLRDLTQTKVTPLSFSLANGASVASGDLLTITCNTSAAIYYTTDGSIPTASSTKYASGIKIASSVTVKAIAITGTISSEIKEASYTVDTSLLKSPEICGVISGRVYTDAIDFTITNNASEGSVYYTIDGTIPTAASTLYQSTVTLTEAKTYTISAIAISGDKKSAVVSVTFSISKDNVTLPEITPAAGTYTTTVNVSISCSTVGANIYYTTDGSIPTASSTKYTSSFSLTENGTFTIKAVGIKNSTVSEVSSVTYVIEKPTQTVSTPVISPAEATYTTAQTVSITCATADATIYYTTDGSTPSINSDKYTVGFQVSATSTIKAFAVKNGYEDSTVASAKITINPDVTFDGIQIQVEKSLGYEMIHYWSCSDKTKYPDTSWPGTAMDTTYEDCYIFEFNSVDSVSLLITNSSANKLCSTNIVLTTKGAYKITSSGAEASTYRSKAPKAPTVSISPSSGSISLTGSFTITVTSSTALTSATATINGTNKTLAIGANSFNVSDYVTAEGQTISISASAENTIGKGSDSATLTTMKIVQVDDIDNLRIYQVMVCSFIDGDSSIGYDWQWAGYRANGDLQGVINSLDYIKECGFNAVWMTPIFETYSGQQAHNGYFANNYFNIDPKFGTKEKFKELVDTAHSKNMYVILDGVLGHNAGSNIAASPNGKTPDTNNPVNYSSGDSLAFYKEVVYYWIKNYKIDGWRFDQSYQLGPGNSEHKGQGSGFYWDDIRQEVERACTENKNAGDKWGTLGYMVGEDWEDESGITQNTYGSSEQGLPSAFDFPTRYKVVQTFAREEYGKEINDASNLVINHNSYPSWAHPNLFMGNHDVARFGDLINYSSSHNNNYWNRHKAAMTYLAAFSGPITVYYGEEWGAKTGNSDLKSMHVARSDGKTSGFTSDEEDLRQYVKKVMEFRASNSACWQEKTGTLIKASGNEYSMLKYDSDTGNKVLYCLNIGTSSTTFSVSVSGATKLTDGVTGTSITGSGSFSIPMNAVEGRLFKVE